MRGLAVYLSSTALGAGLFLAAQSLPERAMALHPEAPRPTFALDSRVSDRLSGSAEFSRAIAEGRAPVPWARAYNAAWVPEETPAPSIASLVARAPVAPPVQVDAGNATREARFLAKAMRGSTELAVSATPRAPAGRTSGLPHSAAVERNAQAVAPKWAAGAATGRRCASPNMG
jgi:hypothetical protein